MIWSVLHGYFYTIFVGKIHNEKIFILVHFIFTNLMMRFTMNLLNDFTYPFPYG